MTFLFHLQFRRISLTACFHARGTYPSVGFVIDNSLTGVGNELGRRPAHISTIQVWCGGICCGVVLCGIVWCVVLCCAMAWYCEGPGLVWGIPGRLEGSSDTRPATTGGDRGVSCVRKYSMVWSGTSGAHSYWHITSNCRKDQNSLYTSIQSTARHKSYSFP